MDSLEKASVQQNIEPFAAFLGLLVNEGMQGRTVAIIPGAGLAVVQPNASPHDGNNFLPHPRIPPISDCPDYAENL